MGSDRFDLTPSASEGQCPGADRSAISAEHPAALAQSNLPPSRGFRRILQQFQDPARLAQALLLSPSGKTPPAVKTTPAATKKDLVSCR
jgi:hypothetical protein